jgi:hypothetical protein
MRSRDEEEDCDDKGGCDECPSRIEHREEEKEWRVAWVALDLGPAESMPDRKRLVQGKEQRAVAEVARDRSRRKNVENRGKK